MLSRRKEINKGLLTRSTAEIQGQNLGRGGNDFNKFANQKNQEIAEGNRL